MITDFGRFDFVQIFNSEFIKVCRDGLFNLINNNGEYLMTEWVQLIEPRGNGFDVVNVENGRRVRRQYTSTDAFHRSERIRTMVHNGNVPSFVDVNDVVTLDEVRTVNGINFIAKVLFFGQELFLSDEGKLYYADGTLFVVPEFAITQTDINRLTKRARTLCLLLNSEYNEKELTPNLCIANNPVFVFGFNNEDMVYSTAHSKVVHPKIHNTWGGNSIKLRVCQNAMSEQVFNMLKDYLTTENGYSLWEGKGWYTKQFQPENVEDVILEMEKLLGLAFY